MPSTKRKIPYTAGTIAALVSSYVGTAAFQNLAEATKRKRRKTLERFASEHGAKRVALLERRHVQEMMDAKRTTPGSAQIFLSSLSVLDGPCDRYWHSKRQSNVRS